MNEDDTLIPSPLFASEEYKRYPSASGTHVFIVGVGHYLHLPGGSEDTADETLGLNQLKSPPVSAKDIANWFLGATKNSSEWGNGFHNPKAPLATIWMLLSPAERFRLPDGNEVDVLRASMANIQRYFLQWLQAVKGSIEVKDSSEKETNPDNIGVFYFCGHGLQGLNSYLLADDYGNPNLPSLPNIFDIDFTAMAARRKVSGALYFFIDACRELKTSIDIQRPHPLKEPKDSDKVICPTRLMLWATGEGAKAFGFGLGNSRSRFTEALLQALSGVYGQIEESGTHWVVTGEALAKEVKDQVAAGNKLEDTLPFQQIEAQIIGSKPFQYLDSKPTKDGGFCSRWEANLAIREEIYRILGNISIPFLVLEKFAELSEEKNRKIDKLEDKVNELVTRFQSINARLDAEPDSDLIRKAKGLNNAGKFEEAGKILDQLIEAEEPAIERIASRFLMRAETWVLQGKRKEALLQFKKAYMLKENDPEFALPYAETLKDLQELPMAEKVYFNLIIHLRGLSDSERTPFEPKLALAHLGLGMVYKYSSQGMKEKALALHEAEKNIDEAVDLYQRLLHNDPTSIRPLLAKALLESGLFHRDFTHNYRMSEAAFRLALCIYRKLVSEGFKKHLRDLVGTLSNISSVYLENSNVYKQKGYLNCETEYLNRAAARGQEAIKILEPLLKEGSVFISPVEAVVLTNLANVYMHFNPPRFDEAQKAYERVIEIAEELARKDPEVYRPRLWAVHCNLGEAFFVAKCFKEAEEEFLRAHEINLQLFKAHPLENRGRLSNTFNYLASFYTETQNQEAYDKVMQEWLEYT